MSKEKAQNLWMTTGIPKLKPPAKEQKKDSVFRDPTKKFPKDEGIMGGVTSIQTLPGEGVEFQR